MPVLLASRSTVIEVAHRSFLLLDGSYELERPGVAGPAVGPLAEAADGGLMMLSAGSNHDAAVEVQWWDEAPEQADAAWDATVQRVFRILGEYLSLEITGHGPKNDDPSIPAEFTGLTRAAVHCRGQGEARRRYENGEMWFSNVEQWLIQLWPERP
jgi:hypothetical protein